MLDLAAVNSLLVAASDAADEAEAGFPPLAVGGIALGLLLLLLIGLVLFGKGREHA